MELAQEIVGKICYQSQVFVDRTPHYVVIQSGELFFVAYRNLVDELCFITYPSLEEISLEQLQSEISGVFFHTLPEVLYLHEPDDKMSKTFSKLKPNELKRVVGKVNPRIAIDQDQLKLADHKTFKRYSKELEIFKEQLFVYPYDKSKLCVPLYYDVNDYSHVNLAVFNTDHCYFNSSAEAHNIFYNDKSSETFLLSNDISLILPHIQEDINLAIMPNMSKKLYNIFSLFCEQNIISGVDIYCSQQHLTANLFALDYFIFKANELVRDFSIYSEFRDGKYRVFIDIIKSTNKDVRFFQAHVDLNNKLRAYQFGSGYKDDPGYQIAKNTFARYCFDMNRCSYAADYISYEISFIPLYTTVRCFMEQFDLLIQAAPINKYPNDLLSMIRISYLD